MVVDRTAWTEEDEWVLEQALAGPAPVILAVNKVDLMDNKASLLPHLQFLSEQADFKAILPISALARHNIDALQRCIGEELPASVHLFPEDQVTDRSQSAAVAQLP